VCLQGLSGQNKILHEHWASQTAGVHAGHTPTQDAGQTYEAVNCIASKEQKLLNPNFGSTLHKKTFS